MNRLDSCIRANGAIGTPSDGGSAWEVLSGTWVINGNRIAETAGGAITKTCVLEAGVASVSVKAQIDGPNGANLVVRCPNDNNWLEVTLSTPTGAAIYKRVASVNTLLASDSLATVSGQHELTVDSANLISYYADGVFRLSATEAAGSANTKHGIGLFGTNASARWSVISITPLGVATQILAFIRNRNITEVPGEIEFSIEWHLTVYGEPNGTVALLIDASSATDDELTAALRVQLAAYVSAETGQSFSGADVRGLDVG